MKNYLRLRPVAFGLIVLILTALWYTSDSKAVPARINTYSACPPQSGNINVWFPSDDSPSGNERFFNIPFDTGTKTFWIDGQAHVFDNYLRGVLATEVGGPEWNTETLRAKAILARSVVYHRCGNTAYDRPDCGYYARNGLRGVPMHCMQEYRYNKIFTFTPAEQTRYQQAINYGNNPYVTYNSNTFDVQYRDISKEWTNGSAPPHQSIYDPAGLSHSGEQSKTGFIQTNADHWADGVRPSNRLMPPYDAKRLLAHYLTGINFVGFSPTPPDTYRFNILEFAGMDDMDGSGREPLILRANQLYDSSPMSSRHFPFIMQNSGTNAWYLSCGSDHTAALGLHWYTTSFQPVNFEGSRKALCPSGGGALWLQPGQEFPSQANSNQQLYAYIYVNVPPGEYWLTWIWSSSRPMNKDGAAA